MKTLSQIKQEAREEMKSWDFLNGSLSRRGVESFLEETLDRLLDEIEKAVVPNSIPHVQDLPEEIEFQVNLMTKKTDAYKAGVNDTQEDVISAFTRFKGENS